MVYSPVNPWTFPVNPNFPWTPDARIITAITNANPAVVTTSNPHGYSTGFNVRIVFPFPNTGSFGMPQINNQTGVISVLSPTTFSISIDTSKYDIFSIGTSLESPQVIPIGQYTNVDLDDFTQTNPVNPSTLAQVPVFQQKGLQAGGPCSTSQT
jgi:hypothetical protein